MEKTRTTSRLLKILFWIAIASIVVGLALPVVLNGVPIAELLIAILALAVAITIPILLWLRRPIYTAVWIAVYVIVYGMLSWHGVYLEGNFGGSDNRRVWYPAYCGETYWSRGGRQKCSLRPSAWFFLPVVILDRAVIHRTRFESY